ncbi:allergen [Cordyceps fumosorosea ARSEF 2679]|uniref:Allergen n=1 Tax=Cordyceps fumosorosea (strain ARSEF 2679) TaxID=1081104 RepID=A0A168DF07_CORFA|nr:allergen [Cordyceps fumosorosea ARSEF 2679]OAA72530.1 allergen [Cordyceps fumosorosea ARSEF 2679]
MDKAKKAVANFLSKDGKHDTTIDQDVRNPVVKEQVRPQRHEEVVTAIDQEIHQDHHQTVVQPLSVKETLPEKHTYNLVGVNEKSVNHADAAGTKAALQQDAAQYTSERTVGATEHSTATGAAVTGQRTHHHVHHHVQPVIQKETIQPEVVHTTVPVHEVHQAAPIHHETTILPIKTMDEFLASSGGQKLGASAEPRKIAEFDGCPSLKDKALQKEQEAIHGGGGGGGLKDNKVAFGTGGVESGKTKAVSNSVEHTTQAKTLVNGH